MKFIGFIKSHHIDNIIDEQLIDSNLTKKVREKLVNYLDRGEKFAVTLSVINSLIDNSVLGGVTLKTDGYWIWPSYLSHYIEHSKIDLPDEFITQVTSILDENSKGQYPCILVSETIIFYKSEFENYLSKL